MSIVHREDLENRRVKLTVTVDRGTWQKALDDVYAAAKAYFPVEGYAPGTAPREALEAAYGTDALYQEAVNTTYPQALVDAIARQDILIAGTPELNVEEIGPDGYTFTAIVDLYPEVKLGKYKGLSAHWENAELSNDDVDQALADYCRANTLEEEVDRAAMGDEVTLDFEGFVDGVAFEGGKAEQYPLVLGSGMFIPGFEEQVAGIRVGEERDIAVTFPEAYAPELAGKDAVFHIKAHRIVRRSMPELTEEFAKAQGFESLQQLRVKVMEDALRFKQSQAQDAYADALIRQVIDNMEVTVPESMIESQLRGLMEDLAQRLLAQGVELEAYLEASGLSIEGLRAHARQSAESSARFELAMMEICRLEDITVSQQELDEKYSQMAQMYGMTLQQIHQQLPPARLSHDIKLARARAVVVMNGIRA